MLRCSLPIIFPIITELGFDPVWFGIVVTINVEMGMITPPVGLNLFILKGSVKGITMKDIVGGSLPFLAYGWPGHYNDIPFFGDMVAWQDGVLRRSPAMLKPTNLRKPYGDLNANSILTFNRRCITCPHLSVPIWLLDMI